MRLVFGRVPHYEIDMGPNRQNERHLPLDFLRGLAALGVAVHHFLATAGLGGIQSLGTFGVYTFFILSALTMMMVYDREFSSGIRADSVRAFYRNRFARIIPLLALVAAATFLLSIHSWPRFARAFLTGTGLFAFHLPGYLSNSVGAWSLGIEAIFYALFPIICLMATNSRVSHIIAALAISIIGQQTLFSLLAPTFAGSPKSHWDVFNTPLMFAPFFLIGVLIYARPEQKIRGGLLLGTGLFLAATCSSLFIPSPVFSNPLYFLVLTACCGISVALIYRSKMPRALAAPSAFLGHISYSLYLLHPFALRLYKPFAAKGLPVSLSFMVFISVSIGAAYVSFRFIETPARDALRARRLKAPIRQTEQPPAP